MSNHSADVVAMEHSRVLRFHRSYFTELIAKSHDLVQVFVSVMTDRVKTFTEQQLMNEKLMSLGKLSAGLAHELNNPASAISRSAEDLLKHLGNISANFQRVSSLQMNSETARKLEIFVKDIHARKLAPFASALTRSRREQEIVDWLEDNLFQDADLVAHVYTEKGWQVSDFDDLLSIIGEGNLTPVVEWLSHVMITDQNVHEINEAARRISEIIGAVKGFTHMDRGQGASITDLHQTLNATLTMMKFPIKSKNIRVDLEFNDKELNAEVRAGEINQVWTNLIDNAIDAMDDGGTLKITTNADAKFVRVQIQDNGAGIPIDMQSQVFDPFFTTKEPGMGTGLGLDLVRKIVYGHKGRVILNSTPGKTVFEVCLPLKQH